MKISVPVQLTEGMDGKDAKKISFLEYEDDMVYLLGSFNSAIAKLKSSSIVDAKMRKGTISVGLLKKEKAVQFLDLTYKTKAGEEKTLVFQPGSFSEASAFCDAIMRAVNARREKEAEQIHAREAAAAEKKEKEQAFAQLLEDLPRAAVGLDGEKGKVRKTDDFINSLSISTITDRLSYSNLGDYVALDLETCGLRSIDPILEVAAIRFDGYNPVEMFTTLINPGQLIPKEASDINHITDDMVADAPTIWQVMPSLVEFIGSSAIVSHNPKFDLKFLYRYGFDLQPRQKVYDTVKLSRKVIPDYRIANYKLSTILRFCGIDYPSTHRAAADAYAAGVLFRALAQHLAES